MSIRSDVTEAPTSPPPAAADPAATTLLPSQPAGAAAAAPLPSLPGYEVLQELGRGGMGVVYQARQLGFDRLVAVKMILAGPYAGPDERERFHVEIQAVARLQHPNIVQVHEVGEHEGRPFFSMEFCPGGALDRKLNATPLPPKDAAALAATLSRAVQAAHDKGVIHRDLKPANVLLAEDGTPKIVDFGLAKRMDEAGRTATGAVMGTPSYMAPEQAGGKSREIGPATDVYALGAILYECLTGRPPFKGPTTLDTLSQVLSTEAVPPRQLQPRTPRDLETICLKCLEKQPGRRYATAAELADDLGRWQRGEPVRAQPPSWGYVLGKWVRRYWRPLAVAAGALLLLAATAAGVFVAVVNAWARQTAQQSFETADKNGKALQVALNEKQDALNAKQDALGNLNIQLSVSARIAASLSDAEYRADNLRDSANWMLEAHELAPREDPRRPSYVRLIAGRGRGLSDRALWHDSPVMAVSFSPDGRTVLTASQDDTVRLWDAATGKELQRLTHDGDVRAASFSPDGRTVLTASGDKTAGLWDAASGKELQRLTHEGPVTAASFSPDGRTVLTASYDETARLWDAATGKELQRLTHDDVVNAVSFSPDGRTVLTASADKTARLWQADFLSIPDDVDPNRLRAWVLVRTGHDITAEGTLRPLTKDEWEQRRRMLDAKGGDWRTPIDPRQWHLTQAANAEADKAWFAARFHLDWLLKDDPNNANLLRRRDEAMAEDHKAIPIGAEAHCHLGVALYNKHQLDEAIAEYRRAIQIQPDYADAHYDLGVALYNKHQLDEAIAEFRKAIQIRPDSAPAHHDLGVGLYTKGQLDEAIVEFRKALQIQPDLALARKNLGIALDLAEHEVVLPTILRGEAAPSDAVQQVRFADCCRERKRLYATASRFYADAFAAEPGLAEDLGSAARYGAACAAALAGCGQGEDAAKTDVKERGRWRNQALDWLRADLLLRTNAIDAGTPEDRGQAVRALQHWRDDSDLSGVREADALAKLPAEEQVAWRKLWADVDAALKKAQEK